MRKLTLNFQPQITRQQLNRLSQIAAEMEAGDELTVVLEASDAHQAREIWEILKQEGFDLQPHGGHSNEYYLRGRKKKP